MASSENSVLGIAKQTAEGTPNVTTNQFMYMLFTGAGMGPNNMIIPLDREAGGGSLPRGLVKVGATSGGAVSFIPRPQIIGKLLHGVMGKDTVTGDGTILPYSHALTFDTDEFTAPFYTIRQAPGALFGEQLQDVRVASVGLEWRGANFVRASAAFLGGEPKPLAYNYATWGVAAQIDGGAQFLSPVSTIELPTGTAAKVLRGSFAVANGIPLEEQFIVGKYFPDGFDIQNRTAVINLTLKITNASLYNKMMYQGSNASATAWTTEIMREANFLVSLKSDQMAAAAIPHSITIAANGETGSDANVVWSAEPIGVRPGGQIIMNVTGLYTAATTGVPLTITVANDLATDYDA